MSEWIEHNGDGPPSLPPGTNVRVMFRDGRGGDWDHDPFEYWCPDEDDPFDYWRDKETPNGIVAYKVVGE